MKEQKRKEYYLFSPFLRIFHWIMASTILVLSITGYLIATPLVSMNTEPTRSLTYMDWVRDVHFVAAFIFLGAFVLRIYGFIINRGDRLFPRFWEGHYYRELIDVGLHYALIKPHHAPYLRNPLARTSYAGLYIMVIIEFITGFAMYYSANPDSIVGSMSAYIILLCGGEMMVHYIHHYMMWAILLFAVAHVYMVIRAEFMEREGECSSMFSGRKLLLHTPKDACDVEEAPKK